MQLTGPEEEALWYKDAVIYELHVRAFADSDADGVGDFPGLISKLDYLEDLGVTAVWLLPFYPSPLKDDGYDISDYTSVQPVYGNMSDFKNFVDVAHRHNIKVITELVVNHTSDQHPWFQRARKSAEGSNYRNFYVWSDSPEKYREARVIFKDYENSNWSWDMAARQYYWHRFYHHQPDLNYDHPATKRAILRVMDFWLKQGVDGLRVDAVPYLFERDGTTCENLKETHVFLREMRAHIDKKFQNRMLLAEANQWPEDTAAYFSSGDEFHVAFHFPIMPRLFMALRMEDRFPIVDILQQTPAIPDNCQWAIFLRNHDELTLEMVTDEERDYMYRAYAADPSARINLGIRRRLAPLLNNDRKKMELMNSLLFSLPGTPVLYYGDEIGMGDNFYLGDRNGVRTPMQWSPERNAGFSRCNPQKLYLPPIIDPEYHYETVNVENQANNPDSLFWWMKRIIALRRRYRAFGRGTIEFLNPANRKVLAYLRRYEKETILVICNLSHLVQQAQLELPEFDNWRLIDLFGQVEFLPVAEGRYTFTMNPYGFYWFSLEPQAVETIELKTGPAEEIRQAPLIKETEEALFAHRENWPLLEPAVTGYVRGRRWFRGKARDMRKSSIRDIVPLRLAAVHGYIVLVQIEYAEEQPETYVVPLVVDTPRESLPVPDTAGAIIARLKPRRNQAGCLVYDAMIDPRFCRLLLKAMKSRRGFRGNSGEITASPTTVLSESGDINPTLMNVEQSNTSVKYGDKYILKLFRRLEEGSNPEVEIGRFLTERTGFDKISKLASTLEYNTRNKKRHSLAVLNQFIPNEGDAWNYTLDFLERYYDTARSHTSVIAPVITRRSLTSLPKDPPELARDTIGAYLASARLLGQRTGELHLALASADENPEFAPQPMTTMYQTSLYQSLRSFAVRTLQLLKERTRYLPRELRENARKVTDLGPEIIQRYSAISREKIVTARIRCHGDYHLGQILYTGNDFVIIDFEGEPARSVSERRLKRSPLRDVAGMIRSFHYAAYSALFRITPTLSRPETELPLLEHWAEYWYTWVSVAFLNAYLDTMSPARLLPAGPDKLELLLESFIMDKALYEISYELNNRPEWVRFTLEGVLNLMTKD